MQVVSSEFQSAFEQADMYLHHKVVVQFGSNRFNDGQSVTASSTKTVNTGISASVQTSTSEFWRPSDAFNNKNRNTMKWLVCDRGANINETETGDGYRAINIDDGEYERGWWSGNKSDGSGNFGTAEFVQSEFFQSNGTTPFERNVNKISLYLTEGYRTMKEVTVAYKTGSSTWTNVASNHTISDGTYLVEWDISQTKITGLRVHIHKTWDANDYARISELQGYFIEDISDDVISIDINETRQEYEGTVPIGTTAANDCTVELDNTTGRYNIENTSSDFYPYITANNKINIELGIDINQGSGTPSYEYVEMGEFWVDEWSNDGSNVTASFNARDFSKFLQDEVSQFSRVWLDTDISSCLTDLLARSGKMPSEDINIDTNALREFDILYIKDQSIWSFMQEVALADQGIFGFDREGKFYYHSYNKLNISPHNVSVYDLSYDTNIESGTIDTELYVNKVIVKVSPVSLEETGRRVIWSAPTSILQWSKVNTAISASDTIITVQAAPNQDTANLTDNNWEESGYLWLPTLDSNGEVTAAEIVKYGARTDTSFTNCERGYFGTTASSHSSGAYIGEVASFDIEFENSPALEVYYPLVSIIETIQDDIGEPPQAHIAIWEHSSFGAQLVIGNIVNYITPLSGTGLTIGDFTDNNTDNDVVYQWHTLVAGMVSIIDEGKQEVGRTNEINEVNEDFKRRYGLNEITIDNNWIQTKKHAEDIANIIIDEYKSPRELLRVDAVVPFKLELADRITVVNYPQLDITSKDYHILDMSFSYDGSLTTSMTLREVKA